MARDEKKTTPPPAPVDMAAELELHIAHLDQVIAGLMVSRGQLVEVMLATKARAVEVGK